MKESKQAIAAAQLVPPNKSRGRPKLKLTGEALEVHRKALQKKADAKYHQRLKEGLTKNPAAVEYYERHKEEPLVQMRKKKVKVLVLKRKAKRATAKDKMKEQLKKH